MHVKVIFTFELTRVGFDIQNKGNLKPAQAENQSFK